MGGCGVTLFIVQRDGTPPEIIGYVLTIPCSCIHLSISTVPHKHAFMYVPQS